jgi:peptide/nickel transport system permease protein
MSEMIVPADTPAGRTRGTRFQPIVAVAIIVVAAVVVCAAFGSLIAPYPASAQNLGAALAGPGHGHLLGTDYLGRDVLSRVIVGARTALAGPAVIAIGAMVIGTYLGLMAGYRGGVVGALIMRWVDLMYAVPQLLIAVVVVGILHGGYWEAVAVLVVLTAPGDTRIMRGGAVEQRGLPYVEAARVTGLPTRTIVFRHIWPSLMPLTVAQSFLNFATSIVTLAALSFLGLGVGPGAADWGRMLSDGLSYITANPLMAIAPGACIILTAASMNVIGDWLYETLSARGRAR